MDPTGITSFIGLGQYGIIGVLLAFIFVLAGCLYFAFTLVQKLMIQFQDQAGRQNEQNQKVISANTEAMITNTQSNKEVSSGLAEVLRGLGSLGKK